MIKKTLYLGNPAYLSLRNQQLVIKLPEVEKNASFSEDYKKKTEVIKPIEDIGVLVLDNKQITITAGLMEALLDNNCAVITCDSKSMPVGLMLPLSGNTTQNERFRHQMEATLSPPANIASKTIKKIGALLRPNKIIISQQKRLCQCSETKFSPLHDFDP